jgi:hypothetical protein
MYASFLMISRALHLDVFEQPEEKSFFNNLLGMCTRSTDEKKGQRHIIAHYLIARPVRHR